jgi:hypothetical protein
MGPEIAGAVARGGACPPCGVLCLPLPSSALDLRSNVGVPLVQTVDCSVSAS